MPLSLRSILPTLTPLAGLPALPACRNASCVRPPSLWQRWWARHEGVWLGGAWHCSLECFQMGLFRRLERAAMAGPRPSPQLNRLPLGLLLLSRGEITDEQLRRALQLQQSEGGRIGECLMRIGAIVEAQITAALAVQQGCPVFPAREPQPLPERIHWPGRLVDHYRALPVLYNAAQSCLYVGFLDRVDHRFLLCLERMLACRSQACIVPARSFRRHLQMQSLGPSESICIRQRLNPEEMTETVSDYAQQLRAARCELSSCDDHLWLRLSKDDGQHVDLLFRLPSAELPASWVN